MRAASTATGRGVSARQRAGWAFVLLLCIALWLGPGASARAQSAPDQPAVASQIVEHTARAPSAGALALVLAGLTSLCLLAVWLLRRAWQRPEDAIILDDEVRAPAPLLARQLTSTPTRPTLRPASAERGLASTGAAPRLAAELMMLATRTEGRDRECPSCKRRWSSWMVVCPVDGAELGPPQQARAPRRMAMGESFMPRLVCHGCGRRYEQGAMFCSHDGHELLHDSPEEAARAPSFTVCRCCGRELEAGKPCGCAAAQRDPVVICPVEASAESARLPAVPLTVCPRCNRYGAPGQLHCAHDQALLLPVTDIHIQTFPHTGYGPRRKVCRACGETFSSACAYCCHDGEALAALD
jgi:hypothetical protein